MLGRLHTIFIVACTMLLTGAAHGQHGPASFPGSWQASGGPSPGGALPPNPGLRSELLPADRGLLWDTDSPLDRAIHATSHGAFIRFEYLNTNIKGPGRGLLGAPLAAVPDPREPFIISTPSSALLVARVLDVSSVDFKNMNGVRTTVGLPFHFGSIEGAVWGTEQHTDVIVTDEIPSTNPLADVDVIATSLLTAGAPGGTVVLHDEFFRAPYSSQIFGADLNFYYNYHNPRLGVRILPVVGARHIDYDEQLLQRGGFSNRSGAAGAVGLFDPPLVRQIFSKVDNTTWAGQIGTRFEFAHQWFTLGIEPKFGLGFTQYEAVVQTADLRDSPVPPIVDDGVTVDKVAKDKASPIFDLQTYATVHVNHWLNVRVGWSFLWMEGVARAHQVILYNDLGTANPPAVGTRTADSSLWVSTFSVGAEIVLP